MEYLVKICLVSKSKFMASFGDLARQTVRVDDKAHLQNAG